MNAKLLRLIDIATLFKERSDAQLIAYYRNVTPKLAEALKIALDTLEYYSLGAHSINADEAVDKINKLFDDADGS